MLGKQALAKPTLSSIGLGRKKLIKQNAYASHRLPEIEAG
jgi:hypothetical protein